MLDKMFMQAFRYFGVVFYFNLCINRGGLASVFSGPIHK